MAAVVLVNPQGFAALGPLFEGRVTRRRQVTSVVKSLIFKYNSPVAHVPVPARALARAGE